MTRLWKWYAIHKITLLLLVLFSVNMFISSVQAAGEINSYLYVIDFGSWVYQLDVLSNGAIVDTFQNWTTNSETVKIAITPDKKYLYIGSIYPGAIDGFCIDSTSGNLYPVSTTMLSAEDVFITPNGQYLVAGQAMFRIDSTGTLLDTGSRYTSGGWYENVMYGINPRGNPLIAGNSGDKSIWIYHLDYGSGTLTHTTTLTWGVQVRNTAFTPDGSLGIFEGPLFLYQNYDVMAFRIDTTETITDTGQRWNFGTNPQDVVITPDGRFGFVSVDTVIVTLAINTITGVITDTGKRFDPFLGFAPGDIRLTEDGRMAIIGGSGSNIITANISTEGDLTWTGYMFPFGTTYGAIIDMELVPAAQVTGLDSSQWQLYD